MSATEKALKAYKEKAIQYLGEGSKCVGTKEDDVNELLDRANATSYELRLLKKMIPPAGENADGEEDKPLTGTATKAIADTLVEIGQAKTHGKHPLDIHVLLIAEGRKKTKGPASASG